MEKIKTFLSTILGFIFFLAISFISISILLDNIINYDTIYNTLSKNKIDYTNYIDAELPDGIMDYVDVDSIVYDYLTNETLYYTGKLDTKPTIDKELLNNKIKEGINAYIDYRIENETGALKVVLDALSITEKIKEEVIESVEKKLDIDYEKDDIVDDKKLNTLYEKIDKKFEDEELYINVVKVFFNEDYKMIAIILIPVSLLLIAIFNFNIMSTFTYAMAPLIISVLVYVIIFVSTMLIKFDGAVYATILNDFMAVINAEIIKFIIVYVLLLFIDVILFYILKNINIVKSHKKGVANLDTLFDDYDDEKPIAVKIEDTSNETNNK